MENLIIIKQNCLLLNKKSILLILKTSLVFQGWLKKSLKLFKL